MKRVSRLWPGDSRRYLALMPIIQGYEYTSENIRVIEIGLAKIDNKNVIAFVI